MKNWKDLVVAPALPLKDAIAHIDRTGHQHALVLDARGGLAGVLSDGDVRRAVLRGVDLATPTSEVMNRSPVTAPVSAAPAELLALMRRKVLRHVPLVDAEQRVVALATLEELLGGVARPNCVVLMAGGLGSRLLPLTQDCPKPLLPVGGKPILETIVENFVEQGFTRFYLAVNYMAEKVRAHFGDGARWGAQIRYLQEDRPLGTAGALSLLPELPQEPLLVMNGDLVTRMRFDNLLDFHRQQGALLTMAVREYRFQVPFGVVQLQGQRIVGIEEKPVQQSFVNAGIYAISPEALALVPQDTPFDMPALFQRVLAQGGAACAWPLREYWLDVGRIDELERARQEWRAGDAGDPAR